MRIANTTTPVLVLGASQHGSLGIIRSLGELGINVYGTYAGRPGPAVQSRYCSGAFLWDFPHASAEESVERLLQIGERLGRPTLLIPTWDETAVFATQHYDVLSRWFILPRQSPQLASSLVDKRAMHDLARRCGIPTAEIRVPESLADVEQIANNATFPVMLKGIDGNRLKLRTGKKMMIVREPKELVRLYSKMLDRELPNLMIQEYIPGTKQSDWMFNGYFDENSRCLIGFTGMKIRKTPVYTGMTSLGVLATNPIVSERTIRWMQQLGYRGILDIGYLYDRRDGEYKVVDVNPRVGATFRLFVGSNGLDVARVLYLDMTGQPVPASEPQPARKWMVELDFQSSFGYYRDGNLTIRQWLQSLNGIDELGYFRRDDLRPFLHFLGIGAKRSVRPVRARVKQKVQNTLSINPDSAASAKPELSRVA